MTCIICAFVYMVLLRFLVGTWPLGRSKRISKEYQKNIGASRIHYITTYNNMYMIYIYTL